ncbi:uncharacterized protein LOC119161687 isoform X1 [Rhipicephalus microplus]|uniref:uncharacterized protein LOC119161687 isoform X1 n=1 Tax=Rhipicephalus microplus TaxID=6941 RepID=UPI003F6B4179
MRFLAPSFVSVLGLGAITSAVMSSADSSVLSASSLITKNFYYKILRPTASVAEIATVARAIVCMVGTATTTMALSVQSVYTLWSLSADVVYVMLFPQLLCLFYLDKTTNTYGLICGVIVGLVTRVLCGEPSLNLPVVLKLPFYDEDVGQRFPHRTLCMSLNMATTVLGSALCERLFRLGYLRKHLDYCRWFEKMTVLERGDAVKEETKPTDNARPLSSRADTKTINTSKATPTNYPFPYLSSLKKTDTQDNDPMTEVPQTADPFGTDASRFEEMRLAGSFSSSRASSRAPSRTASFIATAAPGLSGKQKQHPDDILRSPEGSQVFKNLQADCEDNNGLVVGPKISDTRAKKPTAFTALESRKSKAPLAPSKPETLRHKAALRSSKPEVPARKPDIIVNKKEVADPSNQPNAGLRQPTKIAKASRSAFALSKSK